MRARTSACLATALVALTLSADAASAQPKFRNATGKERSQMRKAAGTQPKGFTVASALVVAADGQHPSRVGRRGVVCFRKAQRDSQGQVGYAQRPVPVVRSSTRTKKWRKLKSRDPLSLFELFAGCFTGAR